MKIEDYKKLKQLDRIEWLLRRERLEKRSPAGFSIMLMQLFALYAMLILIFGTSFYSAFHSIAGLRLALVFNVLMIWIIVACLLIDIAFIIVYFQNVRRLDEEALKNVRHNA